MKGVSLCSEFEGQNVRQNLRVRTRLAHYFIKITFFRHLKIFLDFLESVKHRLIICWKLPPGKVLPPTTLTLKELIILGSRVLWLNQNFRVLFIESWLMNFLYAISSGDICIRACESDPGVRLPALRCIQFLLQLGLCYEGHLSPDPDMPPVFSDLANETPTDVSALSYLGNYFNSKSHSKYFLDNKHT